ncbi:SOS response-associated peptidase family protein [Bradyrhizobium ottawaense]|uniref:SOS response-associated peptidase family protein n=1 Tax=Bradyrhizobium ottawaense TaxID=931866 RepID=UPI001FCEE4E8|nr:SOS response-associated peptidase family protein [Bradyrhizobium ottawaense]
MCTLYSITTNQGAIKALFRVPRDAAGNLPGMPAVFPDWEAPIIQNVDGERELIKMRWGLPNPPQHRGINTNIRNPTSPHWRHWLKRENRCLLPATRISERNDKPNPASLKNADGFKHAIDRKKDVVWFALKPSRPVFSFAGVWTGWRRGARHQGQSDRGKPFYLCVSNVPGGWRGRASSR